MKEDATAKELEHLLRDALNTGLESPRGGTPILQLKTVPLQVQHLPKQPTRPVTDAADATPKSATQLVVKLPPDSVPPAAPKVAGKTTAKRSSLPALLTVGAFALAAAGGAAWLARQHRPPVASVASVETGTPDSTQAASGEGAVGISLKARPAEGSAEPPKAADPTTAAATPPPPPTFNTGAEPPKLAVAGPAARSAEAKATDTKPEAAEARPKHEPKVRAPSAPAAAAASKVEPKPEKIADNPTAPNSPPAGSVDALLQQQLKGAIP